MKKLILSAIVSLFVSTAFASTSDDDPKVVSKTTKELSLLLNKSFSGDILEKEELVKVTFVVNKLNQVVVLQVNSNNSQIQDYVKQVLNYKKLSSNELVVGKDYVFEVRFKN
ncbi:hypothetical protein [Flavobacterium sp. A45]|uniref:hypothetical protein n=1 Tax=Flavobacterium sp. A45 TaxID=1945862 RepID=UPI0009878998|nr:hypothetical protein [Flavobacterium sp. A45]OOG77970.1 hypothetical protein B0E44_01895 [Flavobacterium sp. A45]